MDARRSPPFQSQGNASLVVKREKPMPHGTSLLCCDRGRRRIIFVEPLMANQTMRPCASRFTPAPVLARNATLNLLTQGWIFLVLMIAIPKLVFYLGAASFGLFSLAWVIIGYLALLDIGVSRAATKFISERLMQRDGESIRHIVRTAVTAN